MTTAGKFKIDKLWEFQLYEQGKIGDPRPVGEPKREIAPMVHFDSRTHDLQAGKLYALQRREITLDDDGYATFGEWEWVSGWEPTWILPWESNGEATQANWLQRTVAKFVPRG